MLYVKQRKQYRMTFNGNNDKKPPRFFRPRLGFTLVELLVVIAIIGVLIALLLPAVQAAREAARRAHCTNNLKQIGIALHLYHDTHHVLPYGAQTRLRGGTGTWVAFILPHMEEQNTYDLFDFNIPRADPANLPAVTTLIEAIICPSDPQSSEPLMGGRTQTNHNPEGGMALWYNGCNGPANDSQCLFCPEEAPNAYCCKGQQDFSFAFAGLINRNAPGIRFAQATDGLSNTFMVGETLPSHCLFNGAYNSNLPLSWTGIPLNTMLVDDGAGNFYETCGFKSLHPGGANFLLGDSSVTFIGEDIDYRLYNALGSHNGGETESLN